MRGESIRGKKKGYGSFALCLSVGLERKQSLASFFHLAQLKEEG